MSEDIMPTTTAEQLRWLDNDERAQAAFAYPGSVVDCLCSKLAEARRALSLEKALRERDRQALLSAEQELKDIRYSGDRGYFVGNGERDDL